MSKKIFNPQDWLNNPPVVDTLRATSEFSSSHDDIETITQHIEATTTDIAPNYADWHDLGFALADALGENGRTYYQRLSRFYNGYSAAETDKQFNACLKAHGHGVTIKTLFHLAKQAGVSVSVAPQQTLQSPISTKTSKSSTADIEEIENLMPTFSETVRNRLPSLLSQIVAKSNSPEDADLLLLGSLTVFSACLPNIYGIYGGREVFPNLFLFVTAQASAGKGRLTLCRHLVEPIHRKLREYYATEMEEYKRKQAEYVANKKNPDTEQPQEPPLKTLLIPANSSATGVYQVLNDNNGVGLMFETEGDTLANTFKSDYGNFSDGFRKAFHHETISYNRRKDREFVELQEPRLSALLSGTPRQIQSLIPDAENGLFSRFIFYYMNVRLEWQNVFADNEETLDYYFQQFGNQFYELYKLLQSSESIRFCFSKPQQEEFNTYFDEVQRQYANIFGLDIIASVRRLGLISFRIAMVLSALRIIDNGNFSTTLVCSDNDFQTARSMVEVLLKHTAKVYQLLPTNNVENTQGNKNQLKQQFFDILPPDFDKQTAITIAQKINIPLKTAERYLKQWCLSGQLNHILHGQYSKSK